MNIIKKTIKKTAIAAFLIFGFIMVVGIVKFNFLDDDIYIVGESATEKELIGSWAELVPANEKAVQKFTLKADGSMQAANMGEISYEKWKLVEGRIIFMSADSALPEKEYRVETVGKKTLILKDGEQFLVYKRK